MKIGKLLGPILAFLLLTTAAQAYDYKYAAEIFLDDEVALLASNPLADTAVLVARQGEALSVIDLRSGAIVREIPLTEAPAALAVHRGANQAIVATTSGKLYLFDLGSGELTSTVEAGASIHSLAIDEEGHRALAGTANGLKAVDLPSGALKPESLLAGEIRRICVGKSIIAVLSKAETGSKLQILDRATGETKKEMALADEVAAMEMDESLGYILLMQAGQMGLALFDSDTLEPAGTILTPDPCEIMAVNPSTHQAFLSDSQDGFLWVIDLEKKAMIETVRLFERTGPVVLDPARNIALVAHDLNLAIVQLQNPVPLLSGIVPDQGSMGPEGVQLSVTGSRFIRDSSAHFDQQGIDTAFADNEHLTATIPPTSLEVPGNVAVAVHNPPPGGGVSNELTFKILTPLPQLSALSPAKTAVGSPTFTLKVEGKGFLPVSFVRLGNKEIGTRFVSSTVLEATIDSSYAAAEGSYPVTVTSPGEPTLTSNAATLTIGPTEQTESQAMTGSPGVGSLTGRILNTEMWPVAGVTIKIGGLSTRTNQNGEFRLDNVPAGKRVVLMDGSTAVETEGHYPTIPITVDINANAVTTMPFQPYLHRQKAYNFATIDPSRDTILTDPEVPGFEMRIPAGVNITGWDGKRNLRVSVRTVAPDRLPVKPLPKYVLGRTVYMFFFDKVGGGVADRPIPIKAKNDLGLRPGEKAILWYFDESPEEGMAPNDWAIAGTGTVTPDGRYIVTDPGVGLPKFCCGAAIFGGGSSSSPGSGPNDKEDCPYDEDSPNSPDSPDSPRPDSPCNNAGDPVNLATGYFMHEKVDYYLKGAIPLEIKRTYRSGDVGNGAFGNGTFFGFDWWLGVYTDMLLLLKPGNYQYRFYKQPDGTFINTSDPEYRGDVFYNNGDNTYTLKRKDGWSYKFGGDRLLVEIKDPSGNALTFPTRYDGNISSIVLPDGRQVTINYSIGYRDRLTSMTGPMGTVTYSYANNNLQSVQYPDGNSISYEYDASGRMTKIFENGKLVVTNEYNADNRVIKQTHPDGGVYIFNYILAGGNVTETTMTAPNGATTTWRFYDDAGVFYDKYIVKKTTPDGTTAYSRNPDTNQINSVTDTLGRTTSYTYDAKGRIISKTINPLGTTTSYEYEDTCSNVTKITDALLKATTFSHTFAPGTCRIMRTEVRDPLLNMTAINYNASGLPSTITDPNNNTTTYAYDPAKPYLVSSVADALGNSFEYTYDDLDRVVTFTDAKDVVYSFSYDAASNRIKTITDPTGAATRYSYDTSSNLATVFDAKGNFLYYEYDDRNRIVKMRDQLGREELYAYYRDLEITPLTGDNLKSITDRKGQTSTFSEYDPMGRLQKVTYGDSSTTIYDYDAGGRVTSIADSISGTIVYTYNDFGCGTCTGSALNRISSETTSVGTINYTYDDLGRRLTMAVPGEPVVSYTWDDAGRLTKVRRSINGTVKDFAFTYDNGSRRTTYQVPLYKSQGKWKYLKSTYGYDIADHLTSLLHQNPTTTVESLTYTYDPNGNRNSFSRTAAQTLSPAVSSTSHDAANEMLAFNSKNLTYDQNGNLLTRTDSCGTTTFTWDARNRLTGISGYKLDCSALTASFSYDALSRRTAKTINSTTTQFVYDGWDITQEIKAGVKASYVRTLNIDEPLVRTNSTATRYYLQDALGSVLALTDESGVVKTTYVYDAYGNVTTTGETSDNPFQYTGRESDGTGLYYYRARYYSPEMQRFISEDPIGLVAGINFYAYVQNNPINYVDPTGEVALNAAGAGIAAVIDIAGQLARNGGNWRCIDLVETGVAALTGAVFPGVVGSFGKAWLYGSKVSQNTMIGIASGALIRGGYAMPPNVDGPYGRVSLTINDILPGNDSCECQR